jgi:hypothetical protein
MNQIPTSPSARPRMSLEVGPTKGVALTQTEARDPTLQIPGARDPFLQIPGAGPDTRTPLERLTVP